MKRSFLFAAVLAAGALIRLWGLGSESLWHDEAWTWYLVRDSLGDLFHRVTSEDAHPPLYFLVAWPWVKFGDSEAILRLPSAILGVASLPLVYLLGRKIGGIGTGLLSMAFIAVSPLHVKYSQEARSYALLFFLCTLSLTLLASIRERPRWIAIGVLSAAILYTEYLGAFFLLGEAALLFAWSRRDRMLARGALRAAVVALVLFLPWIPFAFHHVVTVGGGFWMERTSLRVLGSEFARLLAFPYGFVDTLKTVSWAAFPVAVAVTALLALAAVAMRRRPELRAWGLLVAIPIAAMAVVGLFLPIFCARGLIYVLTPLALLAAAGEARWRPMVAALVLLGTLPGVRFFNRSLERENWRDAVAHVRKKASPGDIVLVDEGFLEVNVHYYWRDPLRVEILGVGERGVSIQEATARAKTRSSVWIVRRTYFEKEPPSLLASDFPILSEGHWQHVGLVHLCRGTER